MKLQEKDPLNIATPDAAKELFERLASTVNGFSNEQVITAAANLLINAIRQEQPTRQQAEVYFNELFGRTKQVLVDHYDSISGRKKGVFPYHQYINMDTFKSDNKFMF